MYPWVFVSLTERLEPDDQGQIYGRHAFIFFSLELTTFLLQTVTNEQMYWW